MTKTEFEAAIADLPADQKIRARELAKGFREQGNTWEVARKRSASYVREF